MLLSAISPVPNFACQLVISVSVKLFASLSAFLSKLAFTFFIVVFLDKSTLFIDWLLLKSSSFSNSDLLNAKLYFLSLPLLVTVIYLSPLTSTSSLFNFFAISFLLLVIELVLLVTVLSNAFNCCIFTASLFSVPFASPVILLLFNDNPSFVGVNSITLLSVSM